MKRKISSVNTLHCSKGAKFSHTYTKRQSEISFSHKRHTSIIVFVQIQDLKHNKAEIKEDTILISGHHNKAKCQNT